MRTLPGPNRTFLPGDCTVLYDVEVPNVGRGAVSGFGHEVFNMPDDDPAGQNLHEVAEG